MFILEDIRVMGSILVGGMLSLFAYIIVWKHVNLAKLAERLAPLTLGNVDRIRRYYCIQYLTSETR